MSTEFTEKLLALFLARQNEIRAEDAGACEGRNVQTTTILSPQKRWLNLWPI